MNKSKRITCKITTTVLCIKYCVLNEAMLLAYKPFHDQLFCLIPCYDRHFGGYDWATDVGISQ